RFRLGDPERCVAVATLSGRVDLPPDKVAIWGELRTENIGVEKVVANVISNPNIRYLVLWGEDVRGHRSGDTLLALNRNGIDEGNRVVGSRGALPYIENLPPEAIDRFREQIEIVDMMGNTSLDDLIAVLDDLNGRCPPPMDGAFIAIRIERDPARRAVPIQDAVALHATLALDPYGESRPLEAG
ncbi:MAG TPA: tetrahydromethanopterin S-methyltransferase subunit A, partial [Thermoplasmata archaeon]|nr:tetrahydromethanopterin S-methyltransferase subunit A [Thermoplasmata archaeon]